MLNDLKMPATWKKSECSVATIREVDRNIVDDLVDILFRHVNNSIQNDRSSVKINALTKGIIKCGLGRTRDGTKEYIVGMYSEDIKLLLDDMERAILKRKR